MTSTRSLALRNAIAFCLLAGAAPVLAGTHTVSILVDVDNSPATGCTVATPAGPFAGVELELRTTIQSGPSGSFVDTVEKLTCDGGSFGSPALIDDGDWPAGDGAGDGGGDVIETYLPLAELPGASVVRVAVVTSDGEGGGDAMLAAPGGGPILIWLAREATAIPALAPAALLLLALVLALLGARLAGRGGPLPSVLAWAFLLGSAELALAVVVHDGAVGDWSGRAAAATDPPADGPAACDLLSLYALVEPGTLQLRVDELAAGGNAAPTLAPVADRTVPVNTALSLHLVGTDPDILDALTYGLVAGPAGASVTPDGVLGFTPSPAQLGMHTVVASVSDPPGATAQTSFTVTVVAGNHPPVLGELGDALVRVGENFARDLSATDPDPGDLLTFALVSGPPGMTLLGSHLTWTPTAAQLGVFTVRVRVEDPHGAFDSGELQISVPLETPIAVDDTFEVRLGETLAVPARGVLTNDMAPGGPLTSFSLGLPDKGTLSAFGSDGSFTYEAPAGVAPPPPLDVTMKWSVTDSGVWVGNSLLVGDIDGDGDSESIAFFGSTFIAVKSDGTLLLRYDGNLTISGHLCALRGGREAALGDVDDDGKVEVVMPVNCFDDQLSWPGGPFAAYVYDRIAAIAYDPSAPNKVTVKWLSPPASVQAARADGSLYTPNPNGGVHNDTNLTIARLAPDEPPSVLWGYTYPSDGGRTCAGAVAGKTDHNCRVVTAHSGADGEISRRFYYAPPEQGNLDGWGYTSGFMGGMSAPVVADLDGDGRPEVLYDGTVWNLNGSVRLELDGTLARRPVQDSAVADFDGDGKPEILTASPYAKWGGDVPLRAHRADGTLLWSTQMPGSNVNTRLQVADVDRNGQPDILYSTHGTLWVVDGAGRIKWARSFPLISNWYQTLSSGLGTSRFPVYDLNGDGMPEVIVQDGKNDIVFLRGDTGAEQARWQYPGQFRTTGQGAQMPTVADLDGDGHAEVVLIRDNNMNWTGHIAALEGIHPWRSAPRWFNQLAYSGPTIEPDGGIPSQPPRYWEDPATNVHYQQPPLPYTVEPRLRTETSFPYEARDSALRSQPAAVTIGILPENRPPVVTSMPPAAVNCHSVSWGSPFHYQILATDPDPADVLSYTLAFRTCGNAANVTVSASGLFSYGEPPVCRQTCLFGVEVTDGNGGLAYHTFGINFTNQSQTVPNVVGQDVVQTAPATLAQAGFAAGQIAQVANAAPVGQVVIQNPAAGVAALLGSAVDLLVSSGPGPFDTDGDGDGFTPRQGDCNDQDPAINPVAPEVPGNGIDENCDGLDVARTIAEVIVEPASALRVTGETVAYTATAVFGDGTAADVTATAAWSSSAPGVASVGPGGTAHALAIGSTLIRATASGVTGQASLSVATRSSGDQDTPTVAITSPADGGAVTTLTQITGTATDDHFLRWEVAFAPAGESTFTTIAEGNAPVVDGPLGAFDPTLLLNDTYTLRLTAWDNNGNSTSAEVAVVVEGQQKIGSFALTYEDLTVPVSGLPIQVVRTYDTRDKRQNDFGIGWRLDLRSPRVASNRVLGAGWQVFKSGLTFALAAQTPHFVTLTLANGRVERFDLVVEPSISFLLPLSSVRARFAARAGTLGSLECLDNTDLLIIDPQPGEVELLDDSSLATFHPARFRYIARDGTQVVLSRTGGVESLTDPNGNTLTIGPAGVAHSAGKGVLLGRDALGRVHTLTDPSGSVQTYTYDGNGDLVAHTDSLGNTTRYVYDRSHGLIRTEDPLHRPLARNEFDEHGRLVRTTNADGRVIAFGHHLGSRQEVITDDGGATYVLEYDERGNVLSVTDPLGGVQQHTYDPNGHLLSTASPTGRTVTFTRDAHGNMLTETDPLGHTTTFTYDANDRLLRRVDAAGGITQLEYDPRGNLVRRINATGLLELQRTYDSAGNPRTEADALGRTRSFEYDAFGSLIAKIDARGNTERFTYDANGRLATWTNRAGKTEVLTWDAAGRLTAVRRPSGAETRFGYDTSGALVTVTDALGHASTLELDALGKELSRTNSLGFIRRSEYNRTGGLVAAIDELGRRTRYEMDALGRPVRTLLPDGAELATHYDGDGRSVAEIDGRGMTTHHEYDAAGQEVREIDPLGNARQFAYDDVGRRTSETDASGHTTTYEYDALGQQTRTILPDGGAILIEYDPAGQAFRETDAAGRVTSFEYDGNGNLTRVVQPDGTASTFGHDEENRLVSQTDALGRITTFEYDDDGRLARKVFPDGSSERFTYDAAGNLATSTDAAGAVTTFEYDAANQLVRKIFPGGSQESFTYSPTGSLLTATNASGSLSFVYDAADRTARVVDPNGRVAESTYDAGGNRVRLTVRTAAGAPGRITSFAFDDASRLTSVVSPGGSTSTLAYDPTGMLASLTYPNGIVTTYGRDPLGRIASLTHRRGGSVVASFAYELRPGWDIDAVERENGVRVEYTYDSLRRLTSETHLDSGGVKTFEHSYEYDAVGNRLRSTDMGGAIVDSTYDALDRLLSAGPANFTWDANGRLATRSDGSGLTRYFWDAESQLNRVETPTEIVTFELDAMGERIGRSDGAGAVDLVLDRGAPSGVSQVLAEVQGHAYLAEMIHAHHVLTQDRLGSSRMFHLDGSQNVALLTDAAGNTTDSYSMDAFGLTLDATGATPNPYRFAGERLDAATGLAHLRAREYEASSGRFLSRDPSEGTLDDPISLHRYAYARNNPVMFRDPTGRDTLANVLIAVEIGSLLGGIAASLTGHEEVSNTLFFISTMTGVTGAGYAIYAVVAKQMVKRQAAKAAAEVAAKEAAERQAAYAARQAGQMLAQKSASQFKAIISKFSKNAITDKQAVEYMYELATQVATRVFQQEEGEIAARLFIEYLERHLATSTASRSVINRMISIIKEALPAV